MSLKPTSPVPWPSLLIFSLGLIYFLHWLTGAIIEDRRLFARDPAAYRALANEGAR